MSGPPCSDKPDETSKPVSSQPESGPTPTTTIPLSTNGTRERPGSEDKWMQYEGATLAFLDREICRLSAEVEIMEIQEKVREHAAALLILNRRWAKLLHGQERN